MKSVMRAGHFQVGFRYGPGQLNSRVRDPEGVFATRGGLQPWARCADYACVYGLRRCRPPSGIVHRRGPASGKASRLEGQSRYRSART